MLVVWLLLFGCLCLYASCQSACMTVRMLVVLEVCSFVCVQVVGLTARMHVVSPVCCGCIHLFGCMWRGS